MMMRKDKYIITLEMINDFDCKHFEKLLKSTGLDEKRWNTQKFSILTMMKSRKQQ
ncbi:MAG: hypothetical protein IJQ99_03685 [Synergistaceae bacterium]|nr:hypothetical protein [Synergistaceae bacterium]MBR0232962.1 hypothetical protein [Synergistaceae bacterium]MBR0315944.1 hypothetical protein [Synergistaceae bacterium]